MKKDEKQEGDVSDGAFSYGAMIVKELGNPKRAKTLHALNHRILRCEKLIREHSEKLTPKCYELIEDYKKEVLIQENVLIDTFFQKFQSLSDKWLLLSYPVKDIQ